MSDFVERNAPAGPAPIQELHRRLDRMEEIVRAQKIQSTPTVRADERPSGTLLEVTPAEARPSTKRSVWRP